MVWQDTCGAVPTLVPLTAGALVRACVPADGGFSVVEFMSWDGVARLLALPSTVLPAW